MPVAVPVVRRRLAAGPRAPRPAHHRHAQEGQPQVGEPGRPCASPPLSPPPQVNEVAQGLGSEQRERMATVFRTGCRWEYLVRVCVCVCGGGGDPLPAAGTLVQAAGARGCRPAPEAAPWTVPRRSRGSIPPPPPPPPHPQVLGRGLVAARLALLVQGSQRGREETAPPGFRLGPPVRRGVAAAGCPCTYPLFVLVLGTSSW